MLFFITYNAAPVLLKTACHQYFVQFAFYYLRIRICTL